jgi:hypothetical protein
LKYLRRSFNSKTSKTAPQVLFASVNSRAVLGQVRGEFPRKKGNGMELKSVWLTFAFALQFASISLAALPLPDSAFRIGTAVIGDYGLDQVQFVLGDAKVQEKGQSGLLRRTICYQTKIEKESVFLQFASGFMDGEPLAWATLSRNPPAGDTCVNATKARLPTSFKNGVRLGLSNEEFRKLFKLRFTEKNGKLTYKNRSRRPLTEDERRIAERSVEQGYLDKVNDSATVSVYIEAEFSNGRLVRYLINRVDSS